MRQRPQEAAPPGMLQKLSGLLGLAEQAAQLEDRPRLLDMREAQQRQQSQVDELTMRKLQRDLDEGPAEAAQKSRFSEAAVFERLAPLLGQVEDPAAVKRIMELMNLGQGQAPVDPLEQARAEIRRRNPGLAASFEKAIGQQQTK